MRPLRSAFALIVATLVAGVCVVFGAGAASAAGNQPTLTRAGAALRSDPVYVDPNVTDTNLNTDRVNTLRAMIKRGPHPIYIAVLSAAVKQEVRGPNDLPAALQQRTGLAGVYAVWAIGNFRADATQSTGVPQAGALAGTAYSAHTDSAHKTTDVYAMLLDYVQQVQKVPVAVNSVTKEPFPWGTVLLIIGLIVLLVLAVIVFARRRVFKARKHEYGRRQTNLQNELNGLSAAAASTTAANNAQTQLNSALTTTAESKTFTDLRQAKNLLDQAARYINTARRADAPAGSGSWRSGGARRSASRTASTTFVQPTQVPMVVNNYVASRPITVGCYPGYGYGRYPGLGWGYYGYDGGFVEGMLLGEMIAGEHREVEYVDFDDCRAVYEAPDPMNGDVGGGGAGWSQPTPAGPDTSYAAPTVNANMDGGVGGGGDGGDTWAPPAQQDAYQPPADNTPPGGGGGWDFGGGGDAGGGGGQDWGGGGDNNW